MNRLLSAPPSPILRIALPIAGSVSAFILLMMISRLV
jgi:hypothetical protein